MRKLLCKVTKLPEDRDPHRNQKEERVDHKELAERINTRFPARRRPFFTDDLEIQQMHEY